MLLPKFVAAVTLASCLLCAQHVPVESAERAKLLDKNPTYSWAVARGKSPDYYLAAAEEDLAKAPDEFTGAARSARAAIVALGAGDNVKANRYAQDALAIVRDNLDVNESDGRAHSIAFAYFYGHLVCGRVALLNGDVESAQKHLLASAEVPKGDVGITYFGPNLSLARELLKRNQQSTVLSFLEELKTSVWVSNHGKIDAWQAVINSGQMPDFEQWLIQSF